MNVCLLAAPNDQSLSGEQTDKNLVPQDRCQRDLYIPGDGMSSLHPFLMGCLPGN